MALSAYRDEILPTVPAEKRYLAAMIGNALEIAGRDLDDGIKRAGTELLDAVLPGGTIPGLAIAIRENHVSDATHPNLRRHLLDFLEAELAIQNPKFLAARKA